MTKRIYELRIKNGEVIDMRCSTMEGIINFFLESKMDIWEFLDYYNIWIIDYTEEIFSEYAFFGLVSMGK